MITVYGAPPTRALRVVWMLEEMGLEYEIRQVDFAKRLEDAEFLAVSPAGSIPGIRDGEVQMMESCAILEYLGAKYGPTPLAPAIGDPSYPAYISFLHFGEASLSAPLNVTIGSRFFAPDDQKQNWGAQFAVELFARKSAALLGPLRRDAFLAGGVSLPQTYRAATRSDWLSSSVRRIDLIRWCETTPPVSETVRRLSKRSARANHRMSDRREQGDEIIQGIRG